jgi:hypothetical protein
VDIKAQRYWNAQRQKSRIITFLKMAEARKHTAPFLVLTKEIEGEMFFPIQVHLKSYYFYCGSDYFYFCTAL